MTNDQLSSAHEIVQSNYDKKKILLIVCLVFAVVQPPLKIHFQPQSLVLRGSNRICTYTLQCTAKQDFACRL